MVEGIILHTELSGIPTVFVHPLGSGRVLSVQASADEATCVAFELACVDMNEKERAVMQPDSGYSLLVHDFSFQIIRQLGGRIEQITLQRGFLGDTATVQFHGSKGQAIATCTAGMGMALGLRFRAPLLVWDDLEPECPSLASFLDNFPGDVAGAMLARIDATRRRSMSKVMRISVVATKVPAQAQKTPAPSPHSTPRSADSKTADDEERWLSMLNTLPAGNKDPL